MHACHDEVEDEKQACVSGVGSVPHEMRPWYQMLFKFLVVFEEFYSQENHAQRRRDREKQHDHPPVSLLRFVDAERHRQTAAQQDACVDGAQNDVQMSTGFAKRRVIQQAIHGVTEKHSSEEQDLRCEETPHSQRRRLLLLFVIVKLMLDYKTHSCKPVPRQLGFLRSSLSAAATGFAIPDRLLPMGSRWRSRRIEATRSDTPSAIHSRPPGWRLQLWT